MNEYVVVHAKPMGESNDWQVLLVMKDRPNWQKGRLNLVGGKVEKGESPLLAAVRELKEETGLDPYPGDWAVQAHWHALSCREMGRIVDDVDDAVVYCFNILVDKDMPLTPRDGETEVVRWYPWHPVRKDPRLMPSLRIMLPLMMAGVDDWEIGLRETIMGKEQSSVQLAFPGELHYGFKKSLMIDTILKGQKEVA